MSENRPEDVQPRQDGDSPIEQASAQLKREMNRRNLLKVALAAPPVMWTLRARPASASHNLDTASGALSGNLSNHP
jgi:hypothetical protein